MPDPLLWAEAAFLGLVQGLTEFLPVSSSAHLRVIGPLLPSWVAPGAAFTAITQLGTEAATLVAFVVGYAVIVWFLRMVSTEGYMPFVWYRLALGLTVLGLVATGYLSPL